MRNDTKSKFLIFKKNKSFGYNFTTLKNKSVNCQYVKRINAKIIESAVDLLVPHPFNSNFSNNFPDSWLFNVCSTTILSKIKFI